MITLTPITDAAKLQEYYRFRYRIYSESRQHSFLGTEDGIDTDVYDTHAHHYSWYVEGKLAGCVRFVEPDTSDAPLPMFSYLTDAMATAAVRGYIAERERLGQRMIEASRFCLAPEYRGLRTAREFVLAMVMTMQPMGFEHGLFDCGVSHAPFYKAVGFDVLAGAECFIVPGLAASSCTMRYEYEEMVQRNRELLSRLGFTHSAREMKKAA